MKRAALVLLLAARVAAAQSADFTREYNAGIDASRLGKYDEAIAHLDKARTLEPKLPGPHRWLAAVAQAQNRWADCVKEAHTALELNPNSSEVADTKKLYESCRISGGGVPYMADLTDSAAISVTTNIPGAQVRINTLTYGGTPLAPRPITPGPLDIEITKPGWKPAQVKVNAVVGIVTDVEVDLEADPNAKVAPEVDVNKPVKFKYGYLLIPPDATTTLTIDGKATPLTDKRIELEPGTYVIELSRPGKDPYRRRVRISAGQKSVVNPEFVDTEERSASETRGFYVVGAGGAALAVGFVAALIAERANNEAQDIVRVERGRDANLPLAQTGMLAPVRTREDLQDARDRHARWSVISNAFYAVGLATTAFGAYYLYKGARERRDVPPPFAIAPLQGGAMIAKELVW
jgi:hypothetical protein